MRPQRPPAVTVIAILHFVFGGLGLICNLFAIGSQSMFDPKMLADMTPPPAAGKGPAVNPMKLQADLMEKMDAKMPIPSKTFQIGDAALGMAFSVLMIVSGIGLLQLRPWGRMLSIVYAILAIVVRIGVAVYTAVFILPATKEMMNAMLRELQRPGMTQQEQQVINMMSMGMNIGLWVGVVFSLVALAYPIIVLIIMNMKKVKLAFSGLPYEDEYDQQGTYDDRGERFEH